MAAQLTRADITTILKLFNQEDHLPGNLSPSEWQKMYKLIYQKKDAQASKYFHDLVKQKTENRRDIYKPLERLTKQLKVERAATKNTSEKNPHFMFKFMKELMTTLMENDEEKEPENEKLATIPFCDSDGDSIPELEGDSLPEPVETKYKFEYKKYPKKKHTFTAAYRKLNKMDNVTSWNNTHAHTTPHHTTEHTTWNDAHRNLQLNYKPTKKGTQADNCPKEKSTDKNATQSYNDTETSIFNWTNNQPYFPPGLIRFIPGTNNSTHPTTESKQTLDTPTNIIYTNMTKMPDWLHTTIYIKNDSSDIDAKK